jgi:hypothetical protein
MKTHRFKLAEWQAEESNFCEYLDIDWPEVHRQAGLDHIQWLQQQDPSQCQLVVETKSRKNTRSLSAEIYSDSLAIAYHLMWAK